MTNTNNTGDTRLLQYVASTRELPASHRDRSHEIEKLPDTATDRDRTIAAITAMERIIRGPDARGKLTTEAEVSYRRSLPHIARNLGARNVHTQISVSRNGIGVQHCYPDEDPQLYGDHGVTHLAFTPEQCQGEWTATHVGGTDPSTGKQDGDAADLAIAFELLRTLELSIELPGPNDAASPRDPAEYADRLRRATQATAAWLGSNDTYEGLSLSTVHGEYQDPAKVQRELERWYHGEYTTDEYLSAHCQGTEDEEGRHRSGMDLAHRDGGDTAYRNPRIVAFDAYGLPTPKERNDPALAAALVTNWETGMQRLHEATGVEPTVTNTSAGLAARLN